jgi:hypothetical protein
MRGSLPTTVPGAEKHAAESTSTNDDGSVGPPLSPNLTKTGRSERGFAY